ncbi:hypothetical protein [Alkalihalobacterium elongatum]|uniref:hypothetical protein n=1 Tax=Alkalihalobacterium elongatum TaxID=2675466 RepID=UPI001C1F5E31|nr:hypothetical protein [Alkalihalobacterium elongatum]
MKKTIVILLISIYSLVLIGCNFNEEDKAKSITKKYYNALMDENYDKAFEQLYLYDYTKEKHPTDGTTLTKKEAKAFYMQKIKYLVEQDYKVKDFEIENIRYEDGHTFFLEISFNVEQDGESIERAETVDVWKGRVWIVETDDPYTTYRDGKMNFAIER